MFADTISITINGAAKTLTKVNEANYSSEYRLKESDGDFRLNIRHNSYNDKKNGGTLTDRHNVELIHTVYSAEVGLPNTVRKSYVVLEHPSRDDVAVTVQEQEGFIGFMTNANLSKIAGWES